MQSGGVARFAKGLLSKPCSCCDSNPAPLEGLQYIWAQRCFSTLDRVSAPASLHNSADKGAETQPNQLGAKDAARVAHASDMRNLRRKWQAQHAQKLAIQAKAEAVKTANKAVSIEAHRVKVAQIKELRTQIHEEKRRLQIAEQVSYKPNAAGTAMLWQSAVDAKCNVVFDTPIMYACLSVLTRNKQDWSTASLSAL